MIGPAAAGRRIPLVSFCWLENKTRRVPIILLLLLVVSSFLLSCLSLWPMASRLPRVLVLSSGEHVQVSGPVYRNGRPLSPTSWWNVENHIRVNAFSVALGFVGAILISRSQLRGVGISPLRPVLLGTVVGTLFGAVVSGIVRLVSLMLGLANYYNPMAFLNVVYCIGASMALVACWKKTGLAGRCQQCGYLLRGLPQPICPECGTPAEHVP